MSDSDNTSFPGFGKFVPGFDFLQNLTKQAGSATQSLPQMPNLGSWVAPTLNVEELDKRIEELKAVQFWLDQNAMALKATIQALEVQKMTLATLKGMNFNMGDVANAFKLKVADSMAGTVQSVADKAKKFSGLEIPPSTYQAEKQEMEAAEDADADDGNEQEDDNEVEEPIAPPPPPAAAKKTKAKSPAAPTPAAGVVDPMQWWGALTQQFQNIAAEAMKDAAKKAAINTAQNVATGLAKDAVKNAGNLATGIAKGVAQTAGKTMAGGARAAMNTVRSANAWPMPSSTRSAVAPAKPAPRKTAAKAPAKASRKPATKPAGKTSRKTSR